MEEEKEEDDDDDDSSDDDEDIVPVSKTFKGIAVGCKPRAWSVMTVCEPS